jgi:hypothetical protein
MSEPPEVQLPCIGCGALNPPGVEVCVGCGYRFAAPDSGSPSPVADQPKSAALSPSSDDIDTHHYTPSTTSTLSTARAVGIILCWIVMVALAAFAFVASVCIAFFSTCVTGFEVVPSLIVGVVLGGAIVGRFLYNGNVLLRWLSKTGRGKPR